MKRKWTSILLVCCLLAAMLPLPADAAETVSGTCGKADSNLTWTFSDGTLTISGKGEMEDYALEDDQTTTPWLRYQDELFEVVIEDGVTSIGDFAFSQCIYLVDVTIPESVASIGEWAFYTCVSLNSITIPAGVTSIGEFAFFNCSLSLRAIYVSEDNPNYASENGVLFNKDKTKLLCCPAGKCGDYVIPDSVEAIGDDAFYLCENLTSITIPASVSSIGEGAFGYCTGLTGITLPKRVTAIEGYTFFGCEGLTSVSIPEGVVFIGDFAFHGCADLTSIVIPPKVTVIGRFAFDSCYKLTSVVIPDGVTSIGEYAFSFCQELTSITLPESTTSIDFGTFFSCFALSSVTIPVSVITIGPFVFSECPKLKDVYYGGSEAQWEKIAIGEENECLTNATIHYLGQDEPPTTVAGFRDVLAGAYYSDAVVWAVENGVTKGIEPAVFGPDGKCTRAQIVTFLWRAAGKPEPETTVNPFTDVKPTDYFYKAVLWASENGITGGTGAHRFSPDAVCTRGQAVTFLYRAAGSPAVNDSTRFQDVAPGDFYGSAVSWAVERGITAGTGDAAYRPDDNCTRAQIVTFLYRAQTD